MEKLYVYFYYLCHIFHNFVFTFPLFSVLNFILRLIMIARSYPSAFFTILFTLLNSNFFLFVQHRALHRHSRWPWCWETQSSKIPYKGATGDGAISGDLLHSIHCAIKLNRSGNEQLPEGRVICKGGQVEDSQEERVFEIGRLRGAIRSRTVWNYVDR